MTDLFTAPNAGAAITAAAETILGLLTSGARISNRDVARHMADAAGERQGTGLWSMRDAYDALELAQVLAIRRGLVGAATSALEAMLARCPSQTRRTAGQVAAQQFSTPATIAHALALAAALADDDVILEPSAGTGLLAAFAPASAALILNELDAARRACLAHAFPRARHLAVDGATIAGAVAQATAVLMNPPFSSSISAGDDRHSADRHLLSALQACRPGARLAAIMPGWFTPDGAHERGHAQALAAGRLRADIVIDGRLYARHGTAVDTRLMVFDVGGDASEVVGGHARDLDTLTALARRVGPRPRIGEAAPSAPVVVRPRPVTLLRSAPRPRLAPSSARAATLATHEEIDYRVLETPAPAAPQVGLYLPYRPTRVEIASARPHPDALVESIAMGSVATPKPSSRPYLPAGAVQGGLLSDAQLETIIFAPFAHECDMPGLYLPTKDGLELEPAAADDPEKPAGRRYRMGFFLGDGTGAGKGRQVAAIFMDRWLRDCRRHVWLSKNEELLEDARRDWAAIGGLALDVQPLSAVRLGEPIPFSDGILFVTYPTLRSGRGDATRLEQILDWCRGAGARDFEGVVAFDEAHAMANAMGGERARGKVKGSEQGMAGLRLQAALPRARVLYVSATGASDVNNLAYARRLDLWGPATAFPNRDNFVEQIRAGGVAAMEVVARELKAKGLYAARVLSFAGVEYEPLEHVLTERQIAEYDTYADAWAIIHQNLQQVLVATGIVDGMSGETLNAGAKSAALSVFEGTKQRFFGQLLLSAKLPSLLQAIRQDLADGHSVVVQLVSTAEAVLDRRLAELTPEEAEDLSIDLSPREYMLDYLQAGFPTLQMEVVTNADGSKSSRRCYDDAGNVRHSAVAIAARDRLLEQLAAMPPIPMALDAILAAFGTAAVAEVTGRTRRLVVLPDGRQKIERRSGRSNIVETDAFMAGNKRILVFSDAGGTGRSYHASLDHANQARRIHYLLEPGWRADAAIQGLGRTHRTFQASAPLFRPVTTDCRGERRFISTIARRLDSLGALTRGQRQTGGQNMFNPADNLESSYAKDALLSWYRLLHAGKLASTTLKRFEELTGLKLTDNSGGLVEDLPPIQRWLNRLLAMRIATQNAIFEEFAGLIETRVAAARRAGTLDVGVETVRVETITTLNDQVARVDEQTGATTHLLTLALERRIPFVEADEALDVHGADPTCMLVVNGRSGQAAIRVKGLSHMDGDGSAIPTFDLHRPTRRQWIEASAFDDTHWREASKDQWRAAWVAETTELAATLRKETVYFMTGLLLPVWNKLPKGHVRVVRLVDGEGRGLIGREIPAMLLDEVGRNLGLDVAVQLDADAIATTVMETGKPMTFAGVDILTVRRAVVGGQRRVELTDWAGARLDWYKAKGCVSEIISWRTRLFLPVGREAAVLRTLAHA